LLWGIVACRKSSRDIHAFNRQTATFNTAARLTHIEYGTSSQPAHFDRFQNAISAAKKPPMTGCFSTAVRESKNSAE
jgi:hypothetical protein